MGAFTLIRRAAATNSRPDLRLRMFWQQSKLYMQEDEVSDTTQSGKFLGIDYGEKRIGLSFGDGLLGVAVPCRAACGKTKKARFAAIETAITQRGITGLVVGYPYNMDGSKGAKAAEVDAFIEELQKRFDLPIHRLDERLTTVQARDDLKVFGHKRRTGRRTPPPGDIDSRAATLILQDFLDGICSS